jgi:hypothetical protein
MCVDLRRTDVLVPEQFLDRSDVVTSFKKMRGERMPEGVASGVLHNPRPLDGFFGRPLEHRLVHVLPALFAGLGVLPPVFWMSAVGILPFTFSKHVFSVV